MWRLRTHYICKKGNEGNAQFYPLKADDTVWPMKYNTSTYLFILKLNGKSHLETVCAECLKDINLLRVVQSHKWGAKRGTHSRIWHQTIKSEIDYICTVNDWTKEYYIIWRLEVVQNQANWITTETFKQALLKAIYRIFWKSYIFSFYD